MKPLRPGLRETGSGSPHRSESSPQADRLQVSWLYDLPNFYSQKLHLQDDIEISQNKYLNNIIEQDHRPIKQLCRATLGFKKFRTATITIGGFESMRIIRKRQIRAEGETSAEIFYSLAA